MYVPESLWPRVQESLVNIHKQVKLGSALDTDTYVSAVIDDKVHVLHIFQISKNLFNSVYIFHVSRHPAPLPNCDLFPLVVKKYLFNFKIAFFVLYKNFIYWRNFLVLVYHYH